MVRQTVSDLRRDVRQHWRTVIAGTVAMPGRLYGLVIAVWLAATLLVWRSNLLQAHDDTLAHLVIARRLLDSLEPGLGQLGVVWLPLPQLLLAPVVAIDPIWHSGLAGALLGLVYLQAATGALYRTGRILGGQACAWVAVAVFLTNPNTLYQFTTAGAEAPALMFTCLCAAAVANALAGFRRGDPRPGMIIAASGAASGAILSHYAGWALAAIAGLVLVGGSYFWLRRRRRRITEAVSIAYTITPVNAALLWLLYNLIVFDNPLAFIRGEHSSSAIVSDLAARGIIPTAGGLPPEAGHPWLALTTYVQAAVDVNGLLLTALAGVGVLVALLRVRGQPQNLVLLALAAPSLYYLLALALGQAVIVNRAASPEAFLNVRYGGLMAPLVALSLAALVTPFGRHARIAGAAVAVAALGSTISQFREPMGPVTVAEAAVQQRAAAPSYEAAVWLANQHRGGLVLMDDIAQSGSKVIMVSGGRPLRQYVDASTLRLWREALVQPPPNVAWIVVKGADARDRDSDRVRNTLIRDGRIDDYSLSFENDEILIFGR